MTQPAQPPKPFYLRIVSRSARFVKKRLRRWRDRHRHPFNLAIHCLGIPLALAGVVELFIRPWYWGLGALVLGYILQYIGHQVEGNDVGEWYLLKKLFGLPGVAISPRWEQSSPQA